jgi:hypothetical protein
LEFDPFVFSGVAELIGGVHGAQILKNKVKLSILREEEITQPPKQILTHKRVTYLLPKRRSKSPFNRIDGV